MLVPLTEENLGRLGRDASSSANHSPTPTRNWREAFSHPSLWLSSDDSSSCLPLARRIDFAKATVSSYMTRLRHVGPEGEQVVLDSRIDLDVDEAIDLPTLDYWKRQIDYLREHFFEVRRKKYGISPFVTPTLSEQRAQRHLESDMKERAAVLQQTLDTWLQTIPGAAAPLRRSRRIAKLPPECEPLAPNKRRRRR